MTDYWNGEAGSILKGILKRKNVKYAELAQKLKAVGVEETANSIANKLSRGSFSFTFVLQCMVALGIKDLKID